MYCCLCTEQTQWAEQDEKYTVKMKEAGSTLYVTEYESGWAEHREGEILYYFCPSCREKEEEEEEEVDPTYVN
jgi:hypothetical protein